MHVQLENTVSPVPNIAFIVHKPTVTWVRETLASLQVRTSPQRCAATTDALLRRVAPQRHQTRLRKGQQTLSRKQKFSNNWKKAKGRIQRIHARIGNARCDYLHKTSIAISQNHAMVCIEDLPVRNMSKSAAGSTENPGKHVRAKAGLNKSILDQGWFEFRRQLQYKLSWHGGVLIVVPPQNTSRRCPECDHVSAANRQTQERFACIACGFEENADRVGAINILRAGHARCACEVSDAVRSPAAGTRRSDSRGGSVLPLSAVGIPRLQAWEDVNCSALSITRAGDRATIATRSEMRHCC